MTINQIWEASRNNDYSWMLPSVLCAGVFVLILLSWVKKTIIRRALRVLFALGFICLAIHASSMAIVEKWRIRQEWGEKRSSLTEEEITKLYADGANLSIGPIIYGGGFSFLILGATLVGSSVIRIIVTRKKSQQSGRE